MTATDWLSLLVVVICLLLSAFFAGSETALTASSRAGMARLEKQGNQRAGIVNRLLANRDERALYKMVCDSTTNRVLGLHMIGPDSPEILQAAAVAVKARLTKAQFDDTVALHPTMSEELVLLK